ncbi:hypothetical protein ACF0H5_017559 [Mactra antiquata]
MSSGRRERTYSIDSQCRDKILNLEVGEDGECVLPSDVLIKEETTEIGLNVRVLIDIVFGVMMIMIKHVRDSKKTAICLSEQEATMYVKNVKAALAIAKKYKNAKTSKLIDVPFNLSPDSNDYIKAYLFCKQSSFNGDILIDLRRCHRKDDNTFYYTKQGVRLTQSKAEILAQILDRCRTTICRKVDETIEGLKLVKCCLLAYTIRELRWKDKECEGCKINHPSQRQHMEDGGCCSDWSDVVNQLWESAWMLVIS